MPVCVRHGPHASQRVRQGGCTGSDPGLTRGMATLNRVCELGVRVARREHENEASVTSVKVLPFTYLRLRLYVLVCCE
jgi:hypothetical protein